MNTLIVVLNHIFVIIAVSDFNDVAESEWVVNQKLKQADTSPERRLFVKFILKFGF